VDEDRNMPTQMRVLPLSPADQKPEADIAVGIQLMS
jgi:hypothetical protein